MDHLTAQISARLDADNRWSDMALMRKVAAEMVRDVRQRIVTVEQVAGCSIIDAPARLAEWALGHSIGVSVHPITGDGTVAVRVPSQTTAHTHAVLRTYTGSHAVEMAAYLEQRFCEAWDASDPRAKAASEQGQPDRSVLPPSDRRPTSSKECS